MLNPGDTNRSLFLAELTTDGDARAHLVEALRHAAATLDGTGRAFDELTVARVGPKVAAVLRDAAQRLCDHARTSNSGRCRYCETLMDTVEGG